MAAKNQDRVATRSTPGKIQVEPSVAAGRDEVEAGRGRAAAEVEFARTLNGQNGGNHQIPNTENLSLAVPGRVRATSHLPNLTSGTFASRGRHSLHVVQMPAVHTKGTRTYAMPGCSPCDVDGQQHVRPAPASTSVIPTSLGGASLVIRDGEVIGRARNEVQTETVEHLGTSSDSGRMAADSVYEAKIEQLTADVNALQGQLDVFKVDVQKLISHALAFRQALQAHKDSTRIFVHEEMMQLRKLVDEVKAELAYALQNGSADTELRVMNSFGDKMVGVSQRLESKFQELFARRVEGSERRRVAYAQQTYAVIQTPGAEPMPLHHNAENLANLHLDTQLAVSHHLQDLSEVPNANRNTILHPHYGSVAPGGENSCIGAPSEHAYGEPQSVAAAAQNPSSQDEDVENDIHSGLRRSISELLACQIQIWLLENSHEHDPSKECLEDWASRVSKLSFGSVLHQLDQFASYIAGYRALSDSLGGHEVRMEWFAYPTEENLLAARGNYAAWVPPPSNAEWSAEMALLRRISERFGIAMSACPLSDCTALDGAKAVAEIAGQQPLECRLQSGIGNRDGNVLESEGTDTNGYARPPRY